MERGFFHHLFIIRDSNLQLQLYSELVQLPLLIFLVQGKDKPLEIQTLILNL
jgi:hypothetical protein